MAPPPPSTPTPHRFLVPKRTGGTQRSDTPKPLTSGSQQFHATPRFSLHSTPREVVSSSTPAPPSAFVQRQRSNNNNNNHDSINDIIDSSPPLPQPSHGGGRLHDSIELDSEPPSSSVIVPSSQHDAAAATATAYYEEEYIDDAQDDGPSPKRRRLSVSSVSSDVDMEPPIFPASSQGAFDEPRRGTSEESLLENPDGAEDDEMISNESSPESPNRRTASAHQQQQQQQQQPKFQSAPRFKPAELPSEAGRHREPLPDAFSPRRKGAKYITGGLAAELRDWLMNIEAVTGTKRDGDWVARLLVDDVRTVSNMMLVRGSQQQRQQENDDENNNGGGSLLYISKNGDVSSRVILAGEGRLQGLARKSEVTAGCLVGIARPIWEVNLGSEGQWVVACDWVVLSTPS